MKKFFIIPFASFLIVFSAKAAVYYVRPDGGTAEQCTGTVDAPYPGSGANQPCAWNHPFQALPPGGNPRINGGDTLIIAPGSYKMGYGAPGTELCDAAYPWDCHMPPIPSGPDSEHPTRILGKGWNEGCLSPPELWGTERANFILNLTDSSNVEIACLEITDHSGCVEFHTGGFACRRDEFPYGDWAPVGLYAEDSANVHISHLNIHGLAHTGVWAGRLRDWTIEHVRIAGNGWAGWDGDIDGDDSNSGTLTFRHWVVEWNGCVETYPDKKFTGCWAQTAGGYGDGVGTGRTGGNWVIEDSVFRYNTSDGLDLLYVREPDSSITIRRTIAVGNAGNGIKTNGNLTMVNSVVVGNCGFFNGKNFTYNVDNCRAAGNALAITLRPGNRATVVNSTITGHGDCLTELICEGSCNGSELLTLRNDIFIGHQEFLDPNDRTCFIYHEGFPNNPVDIDYSIVYNIKGDCPTNNHNMCQDPLVVNPDENSFDGHLQENSPAIDNGLPVGSVEGLVPAEDIEGVHRPQDSGVDIGAYEYTNQIFADVPPDHWAFDYINRIYREGITSGCGTNPLRYCPCNPVTREQMAIFILKAMKIAPADECTGKLFSDVNVQAVGRDFCRYIEKFAQLGITSGCWPDDPSTPENEARYCPKDEINRAQMAVFITKALGHQPAAECTGNIFNDVDAGLGEGFCRYIERFRELNITAGCRANPPLYCPLDSVTRDQMAVFLVKGFLE